MPNRNDYPDGNVGAVEIDDSYECGWLCANAELQGWVGEVDHPQGCICIPCVTVRRVVEMVKEDHRHRPGWWD